MFLRSGIIILGLYLCLGCSQYIPVCQSLDEATRYNEVMILSKANTRIYLEGIIKQDSLYYGVKSWRKIEYTPLYQDQVKVIYAKRYRHSTVIDVIDIVDIIVELVEW